MNSTSCITSTVSEYIVVDAEGDGDGDHDAEGDRDGDVLKPCSY